MSSRKEAIFQTGLSRSCNHHQTLTSCATRSVMTQSCQTHPPDLESALLVNLYIGHAVACAMRAMMAFGVLSHLIAVRDQARGRRCRQGRLMNSSLTDRFALVKISRRVCTSHRNLPRDAVLPCIKWTTLRDRRETSVCDSYRVHCVTLSALLTVSSRTQSVWYPHLVDRPQSSQAGDNQVPAVLYPRLTAQ